MRREPNLDFRLRPLEEGELPQKQTAGTKAPMI